MPRVWWACRVFICHDILRLGDGGRLGPDQTTFDRTRFAQIGLWDEGQRRILCRLGLNSLASRSTPCLIRLETESDIFQLYRIDTAHCRECKHLVPTLHSRISYRSFQVAQINPSNLPRSIAMVK